MRRLLQAGRRMLSAVPDAVLVTFLVIAPAASTATATSLVQEHDTLNPSDDPRDPAQLTVEAALGRAGDNRGELEAALRDAPASQRDGMRFLIRYMPDRDLQSLSADFLLENVALAYAAWQEAPWRDKVSQETFFEYILPYAVVNEDRDPWRETLRSSVRRLVETAESPSQAAVMLNQQVFPLFGVKYSTERSKPDQSPIEVIEERKASCSGLSILLIDACRAVGIPARFVGVPLWADSSGNHSWVEVWDDGWQFTGAAEPTGDDLNKAWFADRASQLPGTPAVHAVYATRYSPTGVSFPLDWDESIDYVPALNVTSRYAGRTEPIPEGSAVVRFVALDRPEGHRVPAAITIFDTNRRVVFEGTTRLDDADMNDHVTAVLPRDGAFLVTARYGGSTLEQAIRDLKPETLIEFDMSRASGWGRPLVRR